MSAFHLFSLRVQNTLPVRVRGARRVKQRHLFCLSKVTQLAFGTSLSLGFEPSRRTPRGVQNSFISAGKTYRMEKPQPPSRCATDCRHAVPMVNLLSIRPPALPLCSLSSATSPCHWMVGSFSSQPPHDALHRAIGRRSGRDCANGPCHHWRGQRPRDWVRCRIEATGGRPVAAPAFSPVAKRPVPNRAVSPCLSMCAIGCHSRSSPSVCTIRQLSSLVRL